MKRWMKASAVIIMYFFLCLMPRGTIHAESAGETLKVLVPLMNDSGFVSYEDGEFSGYYIDYLKEIAKYTSWQYEFTAIENYEDLYNACESGEFDLMTGIVYTQEYDDLYFDYPKHTVGAKHYVLAVPKNSELIPDNEYSYLRGIRIGVAGDSGENELEERFQNFCFMYGISCVSDQIQDYAKGVNFIHLDPSSWKEKLLNGNVDGILASDAFCLSQGMYAVADFGLDQIYFVTHNGSKGILERLNDALDKISSFDPEYNDRLYEKYFADNMQYTVSFSSEEQEYLDQGHSWRVGLLKDYAPYTYLNNEGAPAGMITEVLNIISEETQGKLQFTYIFYDNAQELADSVSSGKCDINGISMYSLLLKRDSRERRSMSFYTDSYMYYKKDEVTSESDSLTVVLPEMSAELADNLLIKGNCVLNTSVQSCLGKVEDEKNSYTVLLSRVGDYYKSYNGYSGLNAYPVENGEVMLCFAYSPQMEQITIAIIDKCLVGVGEEELNNYVTKVSLFEHKDQTLWGYMQAHIEFFALLLVAILLVICTLLIIIIINVTQNSRKIHTLLYQDEITGGGSYKKFLEEAQKICRKDDRWLILYMNISSFKYINDVFGYEQGNEVLCEVNNFLGKYLEEAAYARIYADRFVARIHYRDRENARKLILEKLEEFEEICHKKYPAFNIWLKVGAYALQKEENIQKAVNFANYAVDEIQRTSKSEYVFYDETMHDRVLTQKEIERDMREAMENQEFEAFYQPKYNVDTKQLIGAEALVRWRHPVKGLLSPGIFIPIFEKNHYIIQVDFYIFECVCQFLQKLMQEEKELFPISSNFSRLHLSQSNFVERLVKLADKYQVPTNYLEIEITETVATEDFDLLITTVKQLKDNGFMVSIDDFGSGYTSIQLLYKLPIDVLKFDKTFVDNENASELETELVDSIITVSNKNGIQIICEGVETLEQEEFVRKHNCIFVQGFLYSRPVPEKDFSKLLQEDR